MSDPVLSGSPFLANLATTDDQQSRSIVALANGQFVAVWHNAAHDVFGRIFHADGTPATGEIPINSTLASSQTDPVVAALDDGRFVVAWADGNSAGVTARIFNANGTPATGEFAVNTTPGFGHYPSIATLDGGGFVVTWGREFAQGDDDIHARAFDENGNPLGNDFIVDNGGVNETSPVIAALPGGNYVIAWNDGSAADGSGTHVRAQMFSGNGAAPIDANAGEFIVNTTTAGDQGSPSIAVLPNGGFIVTWGDWPTHDIRARSFAGDGGPLGNDFQVTDGVFARLPSATILDDGRLLVTYLQLINGEHHVYGIVRDAESMANGADGGFQIVEGDFVNSSVTVIADGRAVVLGTSVDPSKFGDASGTGIVGQIIDPRESGIILSGKGNLDDEWVGSDFDDVMKGGGGSDNITSGLGQDSLFGLGGDDILRGRSRATLEGGEGADELFGTVGTVASYEHSDAGVFISLQANFADGGHASGDTLNNIFSLTGSAFSDVLAGNLGPNALVGGGGDDTLKGGGGSDQLTGGAGNDELLGGADFDVAFFTGNLSDYAITLTDGDHVQVVDQRSGSPDGTDTLSGVDMVGFNNTFYTLSRLLPHAPVPDVVWHNSNGAVSINGNVIGIAQSGWHYAGGGDFDDDGDGDLLWHHDNGEVLLLEVADGLNAGDHVLGNVPTTWQVQGTGDFDADGDADILWRHDDGQVVVWEMEDAAYMVNHNLGVVPNSWQIAGTGDFDADGDSDIVWRNDGGDVVTWEMEDGGYVVNHNLAIVPDTWRLAGTGDFDADGDADMLWHHRDGMIVTWEMEGGALVTNHNLPSVSGSWQIQGVEDFENDGDADILFRHAGGDVVTWEMQDGAFVQNHNYGVVWNEWRILDTGEFDLV